MESPSDASFNAVRGGEFHRPGHAAAVFFCQAGQRGGAIIRGSKSMRSESMRNDQAEMVTRLVREQEASEARWEAEARATVHGLIQGYIGPDHKVVDMPNFYFGACAGDPNRALARPNRRPRRRRLDADLNGPDCRRSEGRRLRPASLFVVAR